MDYFFATIGPIALVLQAVLAERLPEKWKRRLWFTFSLTALVLVLHGVKSVSDKRGADRTVIDMRGQLEDVQKTLRATEVRMAADMGYLKGQLSALASRPSEAGQIGGAIAKATAEMVKRESQRLSGQQLSSSAIALAQKMRAFEVKYRARRDAEFVQDARRATPDEKARNFNESVARLMQTHSDEEIEFRNTLLGEAVYLRDELLRRLGPEVAPKERYRLIALMASWLGHLQCRTPQIIWSSWRGGLATRID